MLSAVVPEKIRRATEDPSLRIMALDCCEHTLAALSSVPSSHLEMVGVNLHGRIIRPNKGIDLIVIGLSRYPLRRFFITELREVYTNVPVLILRREETREAAGEYVIRGEFILSDNRFNDDYEIVKAIRAILPIKHCLHSDTPSNYETVREAIRVIAQNYSDPALNLNSVAKAVTIAPKYLSRVLNQQVGVGFRELLRRTRIEHAKRMLASKDLSVKEVALRVGFADSHYFSKSFKEVVGRNASEYQSQDSIFG